MILFWIRFPQNFMLIPNLTFFPCLFQYFRRYRQWKFGQYLKNAVFWARFTMDTIYFGPNRLILIKASQVWYCVAMLGSVEVGASGQLGLGPVSGWWHSVYIVKCLLVPIVPGFAEKSHELLYQNLYKYIPIIIKIFSKNYSKILFEKNCLNLFLTWIFAIILTYMG